MGTSPPYITSAMLNALDSSAAQKLRRSCASALSMAAWRSSCFDSTASETGRSTLVCESPEPATMRVWASWEGGVSLRQARALSAPAVHRVVRPPERASRLGLVAPRGRRDRDPAGLPTARARPAERLRRNVTEGEAFRRALRRGGNYPYTGGDHPRCPRSASAHRSEATAALTFATDTDSGVVSSGAKIDTRSSSIIHRSSDAAARSRATAARAT